MLWNIAVNDAGASYDPLTLLRTRTMFGRPDWMTVYGKVKQAIETGQYLPGSKAQLKTKVAVRNTRKLDSSMVLRFDSYLDICLRPRRPGQGYQEGLRPSYKLRG
jgi:hypothetical protein